MISADRRQDTQRKEGSEDVKVAARRRFLANCGKFAVVTPPVVSLMLSAADRSYANAGSGRQGNNGFGNGGHDGVPGHSGFEDDDR